MERLGKSIIVMVSSLCACGADIQESSAPARGAVEPAGDCTLGDVCGMVKSGVPNGELMVASLGTGSGSCYTWNYGWYRCQTYVLKYGQTNQDVGLKDADAFLVTTAFTWVDWNGDYHSLPAYTWTRIHDYEYVICNDRRQGIPLCDG